jgi:hypothetical protein
VHLTQTGLRKRAYGAHLNGLEAFPLFAVGVITATLRGTPNMVGYGGLQLVSRARALYRGVLGRFGAANTSDAMGPERADFYGHFVVPVDEPDALLEFIGVSVDASDPWFSTDGSKQRESDGHQHSQPFPWVHSETQDMPRRHSRCRHTPLPGGTLCVVSQLWPRTRWATFRCSSSRQP